MIYSIRAFNKSISIYYSMRTRDRRFTYDYAEARKRRFIVGVGEYDFGWFNTKNECDKALFSSGFASGKYGMKVYGGTHGLLR